MSGAIRTIRGDDLTKVMLDDFAPYLEDFEGFRESVRRAEMEYGCPVTRIEWVPFADGRQGIMEKRYFHEDDAVCPDWELNAAIVGVDSL